MSKKGIFCLEGLWENNLTKKSTVQPILSLLELNEKIKFIYKDCGTVPEFEFYINKWVNLKKRYPILYLAFHGEEGIIQIGDESYKIVNLEKILSNQCKNCIIFFGSCSTLKGDKRNLTRFIRNTKVLSICGYKTDVDWMISTAFELLVLSAMQDNVFDGRGIGAIEKRIKENPLAKELDFRIITKKEA